MDEALVNVGRAALAALTILACGVPVRGEGKASGGELVITTDTMLDPGRVYGRIVIKASNVTIDGRGAALVGATGGSPREYRGVAVSAVGVSNVTLRNLKARGWETGLRVCDGSGWVVEGCDFSDNFHDPDFGWGENGRRGGIVLENVKRSALRRNRANRVWDGCLMVGCDDNTIEHNDFSHASNTGLTLLTSRRNRVEENDLSYGLRIRPGEVHARDSTCLLMESGSDDNVVRNNDCTHGGDGIFVRVLNGWVSAGNLFEGNDCSHANNNGIEAWAPRNVYRRNRANHCSYGFWLGASDQTRVEANEASFNGLPDGPHNSPHLPDGGHAGIVFMFGSSSHTVVRGNVCEGNRGAGIALVGDINSRGGKWKAYHWIVEQNRLSRNRWGLYVRFADWINVAANTFNGNTQGDCHVEEGVTRLVERPGPPETAAPPRALLRGPSTVKVGERVRFSASESTDPQGRPLRYAWDLGDGSQADRAEVEHVFAHPGFHRLGLTVTNGSLSDLAWRDLYVVDDAREYGTEGESRRWGWIDTGSRVAFADDEGLRICGATSVRATIQPYSGNRVSLLYPRTRDAGLSLHGRSRLVFWVKAVNENTPAWQFTNPIVSLHQADDRAVVLTPKTDLMSQRPNNEEREGWTRFSVPLEGDAEWTREGPAITTVSFITIGFDSWGAPPLRIWIDGLSWQ